MKTKKILGDNCPSGLTRKDTLEDALKRADGVSSPDGSRHDGQMCSNKDVRRIVLLAREYRKAIKIIEDMAGSSKPIDK